MRELRWSSITILAHPSQNRAQTDDKNWGIARASCLRSKAEAISLIKSPDRLLMPVFGAAAIRDMFPAMEDVISQLVAKWERSVSHRATSHTHRTQPASDRFGPDYVIDPTKDFTKLTLDAISLASMSYRMNSFYSVRSPIPIRPNMLIQTSGGHGAFRGCHEQVSPGISATIQQTSPRNRGDDQHPNPV